MASTEPSGPSVPDTGLRRWRLPFFYGWIILAVCFLAEFASGMGTVTVGLFFKPMSDSLGWSLSQLTGAVTAQGLLTVVLAPVFGPILDRFGPKPVMLFGAVTAGVGMLLLGRVQEPWQFWLLYAVVGAMGLAELGGVTAPTVVTKWFYRYRGRAMAIATSGITISGTILAPVIGLLIGAFGWRSTWSLMGIALMVVMIPLVALFMRRRPEDMGLLPDGALADEGTAAGAAQARRKRPQDEVSWTLKEALRTKTLWIMVAILNLANLSGSILTVHVVPFFTTQEGVSAHVAGLILSARFLGSTLGRVMWGFLVERVPIRYCLVGFFAGRAMGVLSLVVLPYPFNVVTYVLGTGPLGGPLSFMQPMTFSTYYGRQYIGSIQGSIRPMLAASSLAGPLVIALLYDATGSFTIAFSAAGAMGFAAAALAFFATPPERRTTPAGVAPNPGQAG